MSPGEFRNLLKFSYIGRYVPMVYMIELPIENSSLAITPKRKLVETERIELPTSALTADDLLPELYLGRFPLI